MNITGYKLTKNPQIQFPDPIRKTQTPMRMYGGRPMLRNVSTLREFTIALPEPEIESFSFQRHGEAPRPKYSGFSDNTPNQTSQLRQSQQRFMILDSADNVTPIGSRVRTISRSKGVKRIRGADPTNNPGAYSAIISSNRNAMNHINKPVDYTEYSKLEQEYDTLPTIDTEENITAEDAITFDGNHTGSRMFNRNIYTSQESQYGSKLLSGSKSTIDHNAKLDSDLDNDIINMRIIRNNQNIMREKINLLKRNQSAKQHLRQLTTPNKNRPFSREMAQTGFGFGSVTTKDAFYTPNKARPGVFTSESNKRIKDPTRKIAAQSFGDLVESDEKVLPLIGSKVDNSKNQDGSLPMLVDTKNCIPELSQTVSNPTLNLKSISVLDKNGDSASSTRRKTGRSPTWLRLTKGSNSRKRTKKGSTIGAKSSIYQSIAQSNVFDEMLGKEEVLHNVDEIQLKQADLHNNVKVNKLVEMDPKAYNEMSEGIQKLEDRFTKLTEEEDRLYAQRKEETDYLKVHQFRLSDFEVRRLKEEYAKKTEGGKVNWEKLDSLVERLKFFAKLPQDVRLTLLKEAEYRFYPRGSFIFKQGDYGDVMYVILRGSCNVRMTKKNIYGMDEDLIINCLYDGDKFGELSMMGTSAKSKMQLSEAHLQELALKNKQTQNIQDELQDLEEERGAISPRKSMKEIETEALGVRIPASTTEEGKKYFERTKRLATIEVAESTDALCIPRERFKEILLNLIQKELDVKLKALLNIPFFEKIEPFTLIPLANNLSTKIYKMGEVIFKEGDTPNEFCIIGQGKVKVVKEITISRVRTPMNFSKNRAPPLKNFIYTDVTKTEPDIREIKQIGADQPQLVMDPASMNSRVFQHQKVKEDEANNLVYYKNMVEFATLRKGEFFGGRALLGEEIAKDNFEFQEFLKKVPKAKLSVVADSSWVEIFTINKKELLYIPNNVKQIFVDGLNKCQEYDDYLVEQECQSVKDWTRIKEKEALDHLRSKYIKKPQHQEYKKF